MALLDVGTKKTNSKTYSKQNRTCYINSDSSPMESDLPLVVGVCALKSGWHNFFNASFGSKHSDIWVPKASWVFHFGLDPAGRLRSSDLVQVSMCDYHICAHWHSGAQWCPKRFILDPSRSTRRPTGTNWNTVLKVTKSKLFMLAFWIPRVPWLYVWSFHGAAEDNGDLVIKSSWCLV